MSDVDKAPTQRLFFTAWPPPLVADQVAERARVLDLAGRAVPRDKLHLTLAFHGRCDVGQRLRLIEMADAIVLRPFELVFDRLDCFVRPRIVWLGVSEIPTTLSELAEKLAGERVDRRGFVPHISVMRDAEPVAARAIEPIVWPVADFALVESGAHGQPGGYRTLARWALTHDRAPDMK
ncbi:RNA 2',3'-cyclic phosphodiesterase [Salinisphaera sp. SPP-AMP-43]|uniref:RNA 2',3'-cyclic phosphodiesterase n=1 Tax=Salinisphaera sp. SPP-AMP-43 TaxID=3121288 RepID=UPI003C6DE93F